MSEPAQNDSTLQRTIGLPSAIALYCGAVLGTGILVLPAVAGLRA